MTCQHCGAREASFHYQSKINGQLSEHHLCADCAQSLEGVFSRAAAQPMDIFSDFFGNSLLGGSLFGDAPFSGNRRSARANLFAPVQPETFAPAPPTPEPSEAKIPLEADASLKQRRHANQLRAELQTAIAEEDFEQAATLRDEIHRLDQGEQSA